jgi:hypothetical protein
MSKALREYKVAFPDVYAGKVMGHLTVVDVEIKDATVAEGVCTVAVDLSETFARDFKKWLRENTDGKGAMKPSVIVAPSS